MEKEFDIEIAMEEVDAEIGAEVDNAQLPLNFLSFGEIEQNDVRVYIKQDVYKALEKYAEADTTKERGTILIGDYREELGKTHVIISDYIEAKYTDASASTLTFTHETWDYVHKQHEECCPDEKIIGWQHTHPNYGIFLSNYDMFIQENFFNLPFQVAYVIDPIQNIRGFFQWKDGKIEKLKGYYVYDEIGKPIKIEQQKKKDAAQSESAPPGKGTKALISVLCVLTLGLGIFAINMNSKYQAQLELQKTITNKLEEQKADIYNLQNQLAGQTANGEDKAVQFVAYTVKPGDSLTKICQEHNLDYLANRSIIFALNGISNPDAIFAGQTIILPIQ